MAGALAVANGVTPDAILDERPPRSDARYDLPIVRFLLRASTVAVGI
jgi:hypothetical protein